MDKAKKLHATGCSRHLLPKMKKPSYTQARFKYEHSSKVTVYGVLYLYRWPNNCKMTKLKQLRIIMMHKY
ncbi:hypothetical protein B5723_12760 [Mammaliicoccus sciuri]|nr:hypothetical protein B5723_12760 [Mammaliicoccus sciuri]